MTCHITQCHTKSPFTQESGNLLEEHVSLPWEEDACKHDGGPNDVMIILSYFFGVQSLGINADILSNLNL